jgi:acetyl esterase/lipase
VLSRPSRPPDEVLRYGPQAEHLVEVRHPGSPVGIAGPARPLVLLVHGGFWRPEYDRTHTGPMSEALAAAGWMVATIEYRRLPGQPDATVQDVRRAIETVPGLVRQHNGKLLLLGHSAGGHLVLWAAAHFDGQTLQGTVALAPVADLQRAHAQALDTDAVQAFLGAEPHQRLDLDPAALDSPRTPTVLLHGELDAIVPITISESYRARHSQAQLVRLAGAGHFAVIDPLAAAFSQVLATLDSLASAACGLPKGTVRLR